MNRHICVAHAHDRKIGYGRMGVDLATALSELDLNVSDWTEGWEDHIKPSEGVSLPGRARVVVFPSPALHVKGWFEGQYTVLYTMWEGSELPEENRATLHEFDQIIVPSRENLELYSRYHPNVKYVPLGVGPEWHWRPRDPLAYEIDTDLNIQGEDIRQVQWVNPNDLTQGTKEVVTPGMDIEHGIGIPLSSPEFVVLTAGTSPLRKGFDLTVAAFHKAFPDRMMLSPRPVLMVKSPYGSQVQGADSCIDGYLTDEEELELYQSAHVYMGLARGEGFGLQPLQAIAQGIPTILSKVHGHEAFAYLGYPVACSAVPARTLEGEECGYGPDAMWWEADVDEAATKLRWVYDNYAQARAKAEVSSTVAHEFLSWQSTAYKLLDAIDVPLDEMNPHLLVEYTSMDSHRPIWHELHPKKYLIRVTGEYSGTVNSTAYFFEPGKDYYDVADVKRMVARNGLLDPSCIGDDGLVKPDERLSGSHSYCPSCKQRLNSQPTKADDLLEGMT